MTKEEARSSAEPDRRQASGPSSMEGLESNPDKFMVQSKQAFQSFQSEGEQGAPQWPSKELACN
jgi:hypothetical protein